MLSKRKLRHLAAGLLGTFISRYNDYEGYWAFGVMYREVYSSGNPVTLDLIAKTALPDMPATANVSRTYGNYLREAIAKFGDPPEELMEAGVLIEFGLPPPVEQAWHGVTGDPFRCTVRLVNKQGGAATAQALQHCMPYDLFPGIRSARYQG